MQTYPAIELPPPEAEYAAEDGAALLAYTIRTGSAPVVTSARIERALHAAIVAGARRKDEHPGTVATIAQAQRELAGALRRAQAYEAEQHAQLQPEPEPAQPPTHEGNAPTHPAPFSRPPAADTARRPAVTGGRTIAF